MSHLRNLDWLLVILLTLLLSLLGVLQYRWLNQLSRWEQDRLQAVLQAGADQLAVEFDEELAPVYRTFQLLFNPEAPDGLASQFTTAWSLIDDKTSYSLDQLIETIYWVPATTAGDPEWQRFLPAESQLVAQAETDISTEIRQLVAGQALDLPFPPDRLLIQSVGEALVLPIPQRQRAGDQTADGSESDLAWVLVVLNRHHLSETIFPALVRKYFGENRALDLESAVQNDRQPPDVLFRSDPGLDRAHFAEFDVAADLCRLRDNLLMIVSVPPAASPPESTNNEEPENGMQIADGPRTADRFTSIPDTGSRWRLLIRHPAGSLAAAVAIARQRNLIIGFGILIILGASLTMLLITTRRARNLARLQMEFVSGVSHDLRTPLAVIASASDNLADNIVKDQQHTREYGRLLQHEVRQLSGMVERIIQFSRFQTGHLRLDLVPVELASVVTSAISTFRPVFEEQNIMLVQDIEPDLPRIRADAQALGSALRNLISNAIKYGGPAKWLRVSVERVQADRVEAVLISVQDRGPGITASEQAKIFKPFYRTRAARATQVKGSGLGLSLGFEIAAAHGGRLSVQSEPGKGSRFDLKLPIRDGDG